MIGPAMQNGFAGMQASQQGMARAAQELVGVGTTRRDSVNATSYAEPLLDMKMEQRVFDASAKVVTATDESLGTLLDTMA